MDKKNPFEITNSFIAIDEFKKEYTIDEYTQFINIASLDNTENYVPGFKKLMHKSNPVITVTENTFILILDYKQIVLTRLIK